MTQFQLNNPQVTPGLCATGSASVSKNHGCIAINRLLKNCFAKRGAVTSISAQKNALPGRGTQQDALSFGSLRRASSTEQTVICMVGDLVRTALKQKQDGCCASIYGHDRLVIILLTGKQLWSGVGIFSLHRNACRKPFSPDHILRKEVIQPQVPLRLPCYDLVPIREFILGTCQISSVT